MHANPFRFRNEKVLRYRGRLLAVVLIGLLLSPAARAETAITWAQHDKPDVNVYFSLNGEITTRLSEGGINVTPNLYKAGSSSWVSWVDKSNPGKNRLKFAQLSAEGSLLEKGIIPSVHGHIYSPSIAVDPAEHRVWAVWAENNGRREVLHASFRDLGEPGTGNWQPPRQITPDDAYSGNLPVIESAEHDRIAISWMRTSPDSSEAARGEVRASDWTEMHAMQSDRAAPQTRGIRSMHTETLRGYDRFIKRPSRSVGVSADEQAWKRATDNRQVLTGAVHSGSGPSARLAEGRR